ncbi:MAG TPA: GntR family transcriptional regulator [Acidimicrobiales bacterium]|nr:GntR family transcriptional regulator [Acidimicrobiales bacterium]
MTEARGAAIAAEQVLSAAPESARVANELRNWIIRGHLSPGESIRQADVATSLKVSRVPVREALTVLEVEGLVEHRMNAGYSVTRWSAEDLRQINLMRRLLESELIDSMRWPNDQEFDRLLVIHDRLIQESEKLNTVNLIVLNRSFHFTIFQWSDLKRVTEEVGRLWHISDAYRSIYLHDRGAVERVIADHTDIIQMIRAKNRVRLAELVNTHRQAAADRVIEYLQAMGRA